MSERTYEGAKKEKDKEKKSKERMEMRRGKDERSMKKR